MKCFHCCGNGQERQARDVALELISLEIFAPMIRLAHMTRLTISRWRCTAPAAVAVAGVAAAAAAPAVAVAATAVMAPAVPAAPVRGAAAAAPAPVPLAPAITAIITGCRLRPGLCRLGRRRCGHGLCLRPQSSQPDIHQVESHVSDSTLGPHLDGCNEPRIKGV